MRECICINLQSTVGNPPWVRAEATCWAKDEKDCPKARAKFRITQWCWRIKTEQMTKNEEKEGGDVGDNV